jgi:hypothetical protein
MAKQTRGVNGILITIGCGKLEDGEIHKIISPQSLGDTEKIN